MTIAGSEINRHYTQGRVKIALDLPKGEKLKNARATLTVAGKTFADIDLKNGKKSLSYYSRPGDEVSLTIKGRLRKARCIFSEKFDLKGGDENPTRINLAFSKPDKKKKEA
ncbi:MAG: hypothetical protein MI861_20030, partial [Pirellulales bacterium]|nr:hypothetical protein [Pirellulales bacterium]